MDYIRLIPDWFQIKLECSFGTPLTQLEIKDLRLEHYLHLASDLTVGQDHNLPVEYGHVGRDWLMIKFSWEHAVIHYSDS